jgi:Fic family protein
VIIPPKYQLTAKITSLLVELESNRSTIDSVEIPLKVEENFRRESILGSSLYSAKIEGNPLTRAEVSSFRDLTSKDQKKVEVANLSRAITRVLQSFNKKKEITVKDILRLHENSMHNILSSEFTGVFRKSHEGIFDKAGNLVYHAPPPSEVPGLISQMLDFANSPTEKFTPIRAILTHLILEKIHPFLDGSGRVGRLLQLVVLTKNGYAMKGLTVVEEEINKNRTLYYDALENSTGSNSTEFVELMLEFMVDASNKVKAKILAKKEFSNEDLLHPRRKELLDTIRDHRTVSLDFLHRRFLKIDPRMLRYDLKALMDEGFIVKIGKTRGVLYSVKTHS